MPKIAPQIFDSLSNSGKIMSGQADKRTGIPIQRRAVFYKKGPVFESEVYF